MLTISSCFCAYYFKYLMALKIPKIKVSSDTESAPRVECYITWKDLIDSLYQHIVQSWIDIWLDNINIWWYIIYIMMNI